MLFRSKQDVVNSQIAQKLDIHPSTVDRLIKQFINFLDYYHIQSKTGRPHILNDREVRVASHMITRDEVYNVTKL